MPSPASSVLDHPTHLPRSASRAAADAMVARWSRATGIDVAPGSVPLESGARVTLDGVSGDGTVFVEAHGRPGPMRDADLALVAQDVFKLALLRSARPTARAVLLLVDQTSRDQVAAYVRRTPAAGLVEIDVCP